MDIKYIFSNNVQLDKQSYILPHNEIFSFHGQQNLLIHLQSKKDKESYYQDL